MGLSLEILEAFQKGGIPGRRKGIRLVKKLVREREGERSGKGLRRHRMSPLVWRTFKSIWLPYFGQGETEEQGRQVEGLLGWRGDWTGGCTGHKEAPYDWGGREGEGAEGPGGQERPW